MVGSFVQFLLFARLLRSLVRLAIFHNSCIKIVRTRQPCSNLNEANIVPDDDKKHFIQISAVAKVVAKEALVQPIDAWLCILG